jgi:hypothetical protein
VKLESLENKSSTSLAVESAELIHRIKKHIEITNCEHCKRVLNNIDIEAGGQPTPSISTSAANQLRHHSKQAGPNEYNKFE